MTPDPGPRPVVSLGCFALFIFALLSFVVLGTSLNDVAVFIIFAALFVVLILAFVRLVFRRRL